MTVDDATCTIYSHSEIIGVLYVCNTFIVNLYSGSISGHHGAAQRISVSFSYVFIQSEVVRGGIFSNKLACGGYLNLLISA
jgi:hypothetical protein